MRLSSKKKLPESCVEKRDLPPAELCELQQLLRQKRSQLEVSTTVAVTGDLDVQQTEGVLAGMSLLNSVSWCTTHL